MLECIFILLIDFELFEYIQLKLVLYIFRIKTKKHFI